MTYWCSVTDRVSLFKYIINKFFIQMFTICIHTIHIVPDWESWTQCSGCGGGPHIYHQYTTARSAFSSSGSENNYSFKYDYTLFEAKRYLYLGQLTAILLLQGGQGLPVLCNSVVHYVLSDTIPSVVDDLTEQMKESFKEVMHINVT